MCLFNLSIGWFTSKTLRLKLVRVLISWLADNYQPCNNRNELIQNLTNIISLFTLMADICTIRIFPKEILDKYHLDPIGHLGHFQKNMSKIKLDLLRPYKFILALKNSNCEGKEIFYNMNDRSPDTQTLTYFVFINKQVMLLRKSIIQC